MARKNTAELKDDQGKLKKVHPDSGAKVEEETMSIVAVAKRAGVSVATVSRVLNDVPVVREATAVQVRAIMEEMGYHPSRIRRGPKSGSRRNKSGLRNAQISVVAIGEHQGWLTLPVMASVVTGISRACREADTRLLLEEMPDENELSASIRSRDVAGVIAFVQPHVSESMLLDLKKRVPLVWVMGGEGSRSSIDHVTADNLGVGLLAYQYLAARGCERLAFIADHLNWPFLRLRAQSFANAAADADKTVRSYMVSLTANSLSVYGAHAHSASSLEDAVVQLAAADPRPTGLFIPTDLQTSQIHPLLIKHGLQPERDIHLISCDNEQVRLAALTPRPPSIELGAEDIGRAAVRQLMNRIAEPESPPVRVQVSPRLIGPNGQDISLLMPSDLKPRS